MDGKAEDRGAALKAKGCVLVLGNLEYVSTMRSVNMAAIYIWAETQARARTHVSFSLLLCWFQGLNSDFQAWFQESFSADNLTSS